MTPKKNCSNPCGRICKGKRRGYKSNVPSFYIFFLRTSAVKKHLHKCCFVSASILDITHPVPVARCRLLRMVKHLIDRNYVSYFSYPHQTHYVLIVKLIIYHLKHFFCYFLCSIKYHLFRPFIVILILLHKFLHGFILRC